MAAANSATASATTATSATGENAGKTVSVLTLGCARNEVDSEELAANLSQHGWQLTDDPEADIILVNTCGFIEQAKRDSIDAIMAATGGDSKVVAVGCLAQRYGVELAEALTEATVLSFDDYPNIAQRLDDVVAGKPLVPHVPTDRRLLLPISPTERTDTGLTPGLQLSGPRLLSHSVSVPVKLASGCDRRCTFCAIPMFRGSFISRRPGDVYAEVQQLAASGVREVVLVSENSTSYGKDFGQPTLLGELLAQLTIIPGLAWARPTYLQPAELRPDVLTAIATTPGVTRYFDLSFQHASGSVLRAMRRFGDSASFLDLIRRIRALAPDAGIRSNFIVGFPGETEADFAELEAFLIEAQLDAIGVFGYSDEEGTAAVDLPGHHAEDEVAMRVERLSSLADELMVQRAEARIGEVTDFLVLDINEESVVEGRCQYQGPEDARAYLTSETQVSPGDLISVTIVDTDGVDVLVVANS